MKVHYFIKASYTGIPNGETKIVSRNNMAFYEIKEYKNKKVQKCTFTIFAVTSHSFVLYLLIKRCSQNKCLQTV